MWERGGGGGGAFACVCVPECESREVEVFYTQMDLGNILSFHVHVFLIPSRGLGVYVQCLWAALRPAFSSSALSQRGGGRRLAPQPEDVTPAFSVPFVLSSMRRDASATTGLDGACVLPPPPLIGSISRAIVFRPIVRVAN